MSTFVNQSGKNLTITCGNLCAPKGDLTIGSGASAHANISTYSHSDCCGLSVGQAYAQYGGWDKQIHVHGNRHSHVQATTNQCGIKMGIFAHCNWGGAVIGAVGTNSNHVVSMIVNNTHIGCWTSSCLYHVSSVKTPILCASSYSRAPYYCVNGQSDIRPFSTDGLRGIQVRSGCTSNTAALELVNNSGTWLGTLYTTTGHYGFLDASWGGWDIKKAINGTMCVTVGSSGFICAMESGVCATTCLKAPVVCATTCVKAFRGMFGGANHTCEQNEAVIRMGNNCTVHQYISSCASNWGSWSQWVRYVGACNTWRIGAYDEGCQSGTRVWRLGARNHSLGEVNYIVAGPSLASGTNRVALYCPYARDAVTWNGNGNHYPIGAGGIVCGPTCVRGAYLHSTSYVWGSSCLCSPIVCATSSMKAPVICATTEFQSCRYQHHWRSIAPGGDYDKFYPISFTSRGGQNSEDVLEIAQSNVHSPSGSCGAMYLKLGFNITGWGHINNHYVVYKYSTGGGNTLVSKVRAIDHSTCRIGVWLRGGVTYYFRSREGTIACNITNGTTSCCLSYDNSNNAYDVYVQYTSSVEDNNFNVSHNRLLNHHNSTGTSVMITSTNLQRALCCGCYANTIRLGDTTRIENQCVLTPIVKATSGTYYINLNSGILNVPSVYANCIYNSSSTAVLGFTGGYTVACTCLQSPILCATTAVRGAEICSTSCVKLGCCLKFTQNSPKLCTGGSYIIVPSGIYVNGGTFYAENTTMHRNGICDDTASVLDIWGGNDSAKCTKLRGKTYVCNCLYVHKNICLAPDSSGDMQNGISLGKVGGLPQAVWGESGSKTGRIEIGLPTLNGEGGSTHFGMVHVAVDIYEYNSNDVTTIIVGGHNWCCRWYNCGAHITGGCTDKTIKLAYHACGGTCNGRYVILLGECDSTWTYGSVHVRSITNGLYYCNYMDMGTPWYVKRVTCADSHYNLTSGDLRSSSNSMAGYQCAMVCLHTPRVCATTCVQSPAVCGISFMNSAKFCAGSAFHCNGCSYVNGRLEGCCHIAGNSFFCSNCACIHGTIKSTNCICASGHVCGSHIYGDGSNLTGISAGGLCGCTSSTLTAVGVGAVASATGSNVTAVGVCSMNAGGGQYASWNTAVGMKSLCQNTGSSNTAVGNGAGECVCYGSASNNVYMGSLAGYCARNGARNTFIGKQAGGNALYGCDNIAIGYLAHTGSFGCRNVIIAPEGCSAQCLANSCNNIVIGYRAAHQHYSYSNCTFIGNSSMCKMYLCAGTVCVCGSLSKSSGCFSIPHPDPAKTERYNLSHSFVESPTEGDNIYRYTVDTQDCRSVVELPDYYRYLNKNDQVWVSANRHFGVGYGEVTQDQKCLVICSCVEGSYNVLLIGTRKDKYASNWKGTETIAHDRIREAELEAKYGK